MRCLFSVLFFISSFCFADVEGIVVNVSDGDTITVLDVNNKQFKIRLSEIDAPELGQPYGNDAKQALSDLVFNKYVYVFSKSMDRYQRHLGLVLVNSQVVNTRMVASGYAWGYAQYLTDKRYLELEYLARSRKIGLWADVNPTPPWEWRKEN